MHLQTLSSFRDQPHSFHQHNKISLSLETQDPSPSLIKTKMNILSSTTSLINEPEPQFLQEKQLFAVFLSQKSQSRMQGVLQKMRELFASTSEENKQKYLNLIHANSHETQASQVICYFSSIWLKGMGYQSSKNKKYLQKMVKLHLGERFIYPFFKIYDNLQTLPFSESTKTAFLVEVCKNGWQFFLRSLIDQKLILSQSVCRSQLN